MRTLLYSCLLFVTILIGTIRQLSAQSSELEKYVWRFGFSYQALDMRDSTNIRTLSNIYYTLNLGAYRVLWHKNDVISFGPELGVNLGGRPARTSTGSTLNFCVQAPVFALMRIGARATSFNTQRFGFGAGIGGVYTYTHFNGYNFAANGWYERASLSTFYPQAVLEGTFSLFGGAPTTLRATLPVLGVAASMRDRTTGEPFPVNTTLWSAGISQLF